MHPDRGDSLANAIDLINDQLMPAKINVFFLLKEINKERGMIRDLYGFIRYHDLFTYERRGASLRVFVEASRHQGDHTPTIGMPKMRP